MWSVHQRLAELWYIQEQQRELTEGEWNDFKHCLTANLNQAQKLADLYNYSLMASMSDDTEWQHKICAEIEKIKEKINVI